MVAKRCQNCKLLVDDKHPEIPARMKCKLCAVPQDVHAIGLSPRPRRVVNAERLVRKTKSEIVISAYKIE